MTGEVNRVPQGLLGLLDMKARGQNPRMLGGEVQAGVDIRENYEQLLRGSGIYTDTAVAGFVTFAVVPDLQQWVMYGITATSGVILAGTTIRYAVGIRQNVPGGFTFASALGPIETFTAGQRAISSWRGRLILRPGDEIGVWTVDLILGTAPALDVGIDYASIPV